MPSLNSPSFFISWSISEAMALACRRELAEAITKKSRSGVAPRRSRRRISLARLSSAIRAATLARSIARSARASSARPAAVCATSSWGRGGTGRRFRGVGSTSGLGARAAVFVFCLKSAIRSSPRGIHVDKPGVLSVGHPGEPVGSFVRSLGLVYTPAEIMPTGDRGPGRRTRPRRGPARDGSPEGSGPIRPTLGRRNRRRSWRRGGPSRARRRSGRRRGIEGARCLPGRSSPRGG